MTPARRPTSVAVILALLFGALGVARAASAEVGSPEEVRAKLNESWSRIQEQSTSWKGVLTAYLDLTEPPMPVGPGFNQTTIWPGMDGWSEVSAWAEKNTAVGKALLDNQLKLAFAMPYGEESVDQTFRTKNLVVRIGVEGDLRRIEFPYLDALERIGAYVTADVYRLCEAGKFDEAFALGVAHLRVLRQVCDQQMFHEKLWAFSTLSDALSIQRDVMGTYVDKIPAELLTKLGRDEYSYLRPADSEKLKRIEMPEGDRFVAEAILERCFDEGGQPISSEFAEMFAGIQSADRPFVRFGAAKRWNQIAAVHGSLDASRKRLNDVYDDWWRRWRMRQYDAILSVPPELSRVNKIRYAAVVLSVQDITEAFVARRRLIAEVNGTIVSAGLCAYRRTFGNWPDDKEKAYTQFFPKRYDYDPYDREYGRLIFRYLGSDKKAIDSTWGRLWVEGCVLYARGDDHEDGGFSTDDRSGRTGDLILWPPLRMEARKQGLIK